MNEIDRFLFELREQGIELTVIDGKIKLKAKKEKISENLVEEIKLKKDILISYFNTAQIQYYPISMLQKKFYIGYLVGGKDYTYNLYTVVTLKKNVDIELLKMSIQNIVDDYEILRTGYQKNMDKMMQVIFKSKKLDFKKIQLSTQEIEQWIADLSNERFILENGDVLRVRVVLNIDDNSHLLVIVGHHIAFDFDSLQLLFAYINKYYEKYLLGNIHDMLDVQQYKQVVLNEKEIVDTPIFKESLCFWQTQLGDNNLNCIFNKKIMIQNKSPFIGNSNFITQELGIDVSANIIKSAQHLSVTLHNFLFSLFEILVATYSGRSSFNIGLPISKRKINQQAMLGLFVDTYWIHSDLKLDISFSQLVKDAQKRTLNILPNTNCSFLDILNNLKIVPTNSHFPIFQVYFNYVKARVGTAFPFVEKYHGTKSTGFYTIPYELMLVASDEDRHIKLLWAYNSSLFNNEDIKNIARDYQLLINNACNNLEQSISWLMKTLSLCNNELSV